MDDITQSSTLINTAHDYARRGWSVLPLHHVTSAGQCSCQAGSECPEGARGKHPRWKLWTRRDAMSGADIETHWTDFPRDNIGVRTGTPSGFFVLDIDPKNGGQESWGQLLSAHGGELPITRGVLTGSGGMHLYFRMPDFHVSNSAKRMPPGIDIRGTGGLVVTPPSISGIGDYQWLNECDIAPAPDWLLDLVRPAPGSADMTDVAQEDLPAFGDLEASEQDRLSGYATRTLRLIAGEYVQTAQGHGDTALFAAACSALELAQSPWNLLTVDDVHGELDGARRLRLDMAGDWGGGQTQADFDRIWRQARSRTAGRGRPIPADPHAGVQFENPSRPAGSESVFGGMNAADSPQTVQTDSQTDPFAPLDWAEMFTRDWGTIDWMLGKFVERGQQMALIGDGKAGKSLLMFEWVWKLCSGQSFLGDEGSGKPLKVLYADRENSQDDLYRRAVAMGATPDELANLIYLSFPPFKPLDEDGATQFLEQVARHSPDVVILDTVSRFVAGGENDSDTWLKLYRLLHAQLKRDNITGIRLDHFGKDSEKGGRGSSAKSQDIDHVWELAAGNSQKKAAEDGSHIVVTTSLTLKRTHTRSGRGTDLYALTRTGHKDAADEDWLPGRTRHEIADSAAGDTVWIAAKKIAWRLHQIAELPDNVGRPRAQAAHQSRYGNGFDGNLWAEIRPYFREFRDGKGAPLTLAPSPDGIDFVA